MPGKKQRRYSIKKQEFVRIPGPERRYREVSSGRTVSRSYVYARSQRYTVSERLKEQQERIRHEDRHQKHIRWFANHYNRLEYLKPGHGDPDDYISFEEAENDVLFQVMENFFWSDNDLDRADADEYFDELEDEYENEPWGETP